MLVVEQHDKSNEGRDEEIRRLSGQAQHQAAFIEALHVSFLSDPLELPRTLLARLLSLLSISMSLHRRVNPET